MSIAKKPTPKTEDNHVDVENLINKGGSVPSFKMTEIPEDKEHNKTKQVALHIPQELFDEMEKLRASHPVKLSRHVWILQAISNKIIHEQEKNKDV